MTTPRSLLTTLTFGLALGLLPACAGPIRHSLADAASFGPSLEALSLSRPVVADAAALDPVPVLEDDAPESHSAGHVVLLYIPNRIFDLLDIVRARLRFGPGFAFGARATELADFYVGAYGAVFVGIPGPRGKPVINWPVGLESKSGVEVSVADASLEGGVHYGILEVGFGGQLAIIGFDLGVDVYEAADFVTGLVTIDISDDDL